jgi:tetratricopeptide (TPR) repeat protein
MVCPRCGSETPAGTGLCGRCASRLPEAPPVAAGTLTPIQDLSDLGTSDGTDYPTMSPRDAAGSGSGSSATAPGFGVLAPGQTFASRYRVVGSLGQGGMGAVYQAWDDDLGVMVALKVIRPETMDDPARAHDLERRFKRELLLARKVSHKNVVRIHDLGKVGAITYLTMTYVKGHDLATVLRREGRLPVARVLKIARQVAAGLAAAHEQGVVHRDLKPANIMVDEDEHALIMDFGIARSVVGGGTASGGVVGTLFYMAPEQARGEPVDQRADIYAFGLILYDLLLGRRAAASEASEMGELLRRMQQAPPPLRSREPNIPDALDQLITRCLQPPPEDRYQTATDLLADLDRLDADGHASLHARPIGTGAARAAASPGKAGVGRLLSGARRWQLLVGAGLVVAAIAAVIVAQWRPGVSPPVLSDRDTILLADFVNTTGEAVFDGALKQALAVQLEQSPFLNIFSESRVRETLRYMGRSPDERVTPTVAKEICERQGIKAMLSGSISPIGVRYVIDLNAVTCQTGDSLAREQIEAANSEHVLRALGTAASRLREKLGESLSSVQKFDAPIEQATTSSLEALKTFSLAEEHRIKGLESASIPFFKHAIELDPNFAMAYSRLAVVYRNLQDPERALEYMKPAMERRSRVTELEKLYINAHYYGLTGEIDQVIEAYELWKQLHPRDWAPRNNLAFRYTTVGRFQDAVTEAGEAARLNPNHPFPAANLGFAYIGMNRFDEAKAVFESAIERKFIDLAYQFGLYEIAFVQNDDAAMARQAKWAEGNPMEHTMLFTRAQAAACTGRMGEAADLFRRAEEAAKRANLPEAAAVIAAVQLLTQAQFGYREAGVRAAAMAREPHGRDALLVLVTALGVARETAGALALAESLEKQFPADTLVGRVWVPAARAAVELARDNPAKAIDVLEPARPYELGRLTRMFGSPTPTYVRGQAYWHAGRFAEAAAEFQTILDHRGVAPVSPVYGLSHVGLARARRSAGDLAKASQHYQDFFALWRNADKDVPFLREAQREYATLQTDIAATTASSAVPRALRLTGDPRTIGESRAAASVPMYPRWDPRTGPAHRREAESR